MGWGCNKHEWDHGSENWQAMLDAMIAEQQEQGFPAWGRDGEICPKCFTDTQRKLGEATEAIRLLSGTDLPPALVCVHDWFTGERRGLCSMCRFATDEGQLQRKLEAAEDLCRIYFEIAERYMPAGAIRMLRDKALAAREQERPALEEGE